MRAGALPLVAADEGGSGNAGKARSLRDCALQMLARRDYSRGELERKLTTPGTDSVALRAVLDELEARGWLSELRIAQRLVQRAAGRYGTSKVLQELEHHGVGPEVLAQARAQLRESELESARSAWRKRFDKTSADPKERARQARFLAQRGFDLEVIERLLAAGVDE